MTRQALAALALVLATLLVPIGITSTWLALRVDDTQEYVDTVAPLADNEELRDRLADEVATAAVGTLQSNIPVGLPKSVETMVRTSTEAVVESDDFPRFWREANADTHREFLAIVHDRKGHVDTTGWVVVNLRPLLDSVLEDVAKGIPGGAAVVEALPQTPLPLPVIRESDLEKGRGLYRLLDALSFWVPLIWAGLVLIALLAARGIRGRLFAGALAAVGVALGGVVVVLLTTPVANLVADHVEPDKRDLARLVIDVVLDSLDAWGRAAVVGGLVVGGVLFVGTLLTRRSAAAYS